MGSNGRPSTSSLQGVEQSSIEASAMLLRQLEHKAIEGVLRAFRAQGPLTLYKEILLDHLKSALFVPQGDYIAKVDEAITDPALTEICSILNPSYKSAAAWSLERCSVLPDDYESHMNRLGKEITDIEDIRLLSPQGLDRMRSRFLKNEELATLKMLSIPPTAFVPERLRRILIDTDRTKRIDTDSVHSCTQTMDEPLPFTTSSANEVDGENMTGGHTPNGVYRPKPRLAKTKFLSNGTLFPRRQKAASAIHNDSLASSSKIPSIYAGAPELEDVIREKFPQLKKLDTVSKPPIIASHVYDEFARPDKDQSDLMEPRGWGRRSQLKYRNKRDRLGIRAERAFDSQSHLKAARQLASIRMQLGFTHDQQNGNKTHRSSSPLYDNLS